MTSLTRSAGRLVGSVAADAPTRLRLAMGITVLCALAMSLGGWYGLDRRDTAIDGAAAAAAQLIAVQDIRVQVVQADSLAARAYLVVSEPAAQRAQYDGHVAAAATGLISVSANAAAGDRRELETATQRLAVYVGLVEQARANNRQGFPVGAAYQRQARSVATLLVQSLRSVEQATRDRVDASIERAARAGWMLATTALVTLVAVVVGSMWLAARWRRLINVPLALAGMVVLVVLTVGVGINGSAMSNAADAVTDQLSAADLVAQARAAGFEARSNEALTLINRGNGAAYETAWQQASSIVTTGLGRACELFAVGCVAVDEYGDYADAHASMRDLDDSGQWESAVKLVTDAGPNGSLQSDFQQFALATSTELTDQTAGSIAAFGDANSSLGVLRLLVVLAGVATAALAVAGYGQRLREYR